MPTLSEILRTKLMPWLHQNAGEHFIVARPQMRQSEIPYGVKLIPHQIQSPRVVIKNRRSYGNVRNIVAEWPQAGLQELGKYLLICVLDGHIDYTIGNYKLQCGPGHFIFIPPGIPCPDGSQTYVDLDKSTFCDIASFLLHPNALECWTSHCDARGRKRSNNCLILQERTVYLFQALMEEMLKDETNALRISEGLLVAFSGLLQRELNAGHFQAVKTTDFFENLSTKIASTDFQAHLHQYVQDNFRKPLTINVVAAAMYLSPAQFTRVMRRETGKSFNEYLADCRMEEAKNLLRHSQWAINVIASFVGFKSHSYFRTFFKRYMGITPTEFRAREGADAEK
jgi:AraC-like DNA-binding protein